MYVIISDLKLFAIKSYSKKHNVLFNLKEKFQLDNVASRTLNTA